MRVGGFQLAVRAERERLRDPGVLGLGRADTWFRVLHVRCFSSEARVSIDV